jgi:hypothetical protein
MAAGLDSIASSPARQVPEEDQMTLNAITAAISFLGGLAVVELFIIVARLDRIIVLLQKESFRKDREEGREGAMNLGNRLRRRMIAN